MAIQIGNGNASGSDADSAMLSEINTTPLVDVMLVLLIIFLITIPVVNTSVVVSLPREVTAQRAAEGDHVVLTVDANGSVWWFNTPVRNSADLAELLAMAAQARPQPEVHIRGDARADYTAIDRVVRASQAAGIARVGFLTEAPAR